MAVDRRVLRRLRQAALRGVRKHYDDELGLTWIDDVPLVVPITGACENISTLYRLDGHVGRYLTQTGQLTLEVELQQHAGVYCLISSFRADQSDVRHLNEFRLVEEEFAYPSLDKAGGYDPQELFNHLLSRVTSAVRAMLVGILEDNDVVGLLGADVAHVERAVAAATSPNTWPSMTYRQAIVLLNQLGRFARLEFGDDLGPDHEAALIELVSSEFGSEPIPVFITHYPQAIKFFNMKVDPRDTDVVLSADLLLPTAGEAVGSAVREDHHPTLRRRLENSSMLAELEAKGRHAIGDFERYLRLVSSGLVPPHAGYGIGLERVLQFVLKEPDIRDVSGTHMLLRELSPSPQEGEIVHMSRARLNASGSGIRSLGTNHPD